VKQFIRLHIIAEGQTEERFVKDTLSEHLGRYQISTNVRSVYTSKDKNKFYRGGLVSYHKAKKDIQSWLREDANADARFTTMFDLYALPKDFPLYKESKNIMSPYQKVESLENAIRAFDKKKSNVHPILLKAQKEAMLLSQANDLQFQIEEYDRTKFKTESINNLSLEPILV